MEDWNITRYGLPELWPSNRCFVFDVVTGVEERNAKISNNFVLLQNYPNPFNPTTSIEFKIPKQIKAQITVYNILGKKIKSLFYKEVKQGIYKTVWDGTNDIGITQPSGTYFIRLSAGNFTQTKKAILLK